MSNFETDATPSPGDVAWRDDTKGRSLFTPDEPLSIANVAKMFAVSRLALRYYERRGLIRRRHRLGPMRVYSWADCDRIAFIIKWRRVGLTLGEISQILKAASADAASDTVKLGRARCLELIDRLDQQRRPLREALAELRHMHELLSAKLGDAAER